MKIKIKIALVLFAFLMVSAKAFAVDVPSRETAGAEQKRFEENEKIQQASKRARSEATAEKPLEESEEESDANLPQVNFVLKQVQVSGNEKVTDQELEGLAQEYIGKSVTMRELKRIASRMKQYYRNKGYIAAYVYIPQQDVTDGIVEFGAIEGTVGQVNITGNKWYSTKLINRMLKLSAGNVIYYKDLRAGLAYLNRNEDIKAKAALKPGAEFKTTDVDINVKDRLPVHISTDVNNLGTRDTGNTRWGLAVRDNNLLGLMDELSTRFQIGTGAVAVGTRYSVPLHSSGTNLSFNHSYSHVDLGNDFEATNVRGDASTYGLDLFQPVLREENYEAGLDLGFDIKEVENKILDQSAGKDKLRILNTGVNLQGTDPWGGKNYFPNSFHFGFADFMGGSGKVDPRATRAGTGGQFFIYRSSFIHYHPLPKEMLFAFRSNFQLTPDSLAPSEQFRLGGAFSVRGYREGEYLADYGAQFSTEVFIPTYFFPKDWKLPYSNEPLYKQIQGVAFFDLGAGALRKPLTGEKDDRVLSGAGGGLRIHLFDRVYGRFQWAGATGERPTNGDRGAFYYGISAELL